MSDPSSNPNNSTPEATAAVAQSRESSLITSATADSETSKSSIDFTISVGIKSASQNHSYQRKKNDPIYRPLKIFTLDPSASSLEGSIALVNVPYEPLEPGPTGNLFKVDDSDEIIFKGVLFDSDGVATESFEVVDLNDDQAIQKCQVHLDAPAILICSGRNPSPSDRWFHQQMVYAVCCTVYATFRTALGRNISWGFRRESDRERLYIRPHAFERANAKYDKEKGELQFGYYKALDEDVGPNLPGGIIFTCLSHDVIVHELTHALLDGLRSYFTIPSNLDVLAFHEAFGDLVAIFQRFTYEQVVKAAIQKSRGKLSESNLLTDFASQIGYTIGQGTSLRKASSPQIAKLNVDTIEPYTRSSILVSAVFDAFNTIFQRKTERYIRLATNGSSISRYKDLPQDLQAILAEEASQLASQFLNICIRAIDYCPPIDLEFGEFLRAVITADKDLVPDDHWGYREAWIHAFRKRNIYPRGVSNLSEDALLWRSPRREIPPILGLSFAELRFRGDPGQSCEPAELERQASALGKVIFQAEFIESFGCVSSNDSRLGKDTVDFPCVQSIRTSRRIGPSGQVVFDLIAEVTQRRIVHREDGSEEFDFYGGATVILGPEGEIRYTISKSILRQERIERQREYLKNNTKFWKNENGKLTPKFSLFELLHQVDSNENSDQSEN